MLIKLFMQMNPSFSTRSSKTNEVFSMGCPQGMVPIQRATRVDQGQTHFQSFSESQGGSFHRYASNFPGEYVSFYVAIFFS
jgi:hypothetical protein